MNRISASVVPALVIRQAPPAPVVTIKNMAFILPDDGRIAVGTTVVFTNQDPMPHTVTSDDQGPDGKPVFDIAVPPGASVDHTFSAAEVGTRPFHCSLHPSMRATLTILPPKADKTVNISGMKFPKPFFIKVGQTVEFVNKDPMPHTVTADKLKPDTQDPLFKLTLPPNSSARHTFTQEEVGVQAYTCEIHPSMHGKLTVQPSP